MADSDDDYDDTGATHIENTVLRALVDLTVKETEQTIDLRDVENTLNDVNMQYMVDFICRNLSHMESLSLFLCTLSAEAVEILRTYLAQTPLQKIHLSDVHLGNEQGGRLLSGLYGNESVKELMLVNVSLEGAAGGATLSALLQNMPVLKTLRCGNPLGVEGARALQPGIRASQTVEILGLQGCMLQNEGLLAIVDALEGNTTIIHLCFDGNGITANGLPHLTRLLQHSSVKNIDLDNNPGLFDNEENTRPFFSALQNSRVESLSFDFCQLTGHAVTALFQAASMNKTLLELYVYDHVRLQGQDLEHLLQNIPNTMQLTHFGVNLDFTKESVMSAFHLNTSIQCLYDENCKAIEGGPVADILNRNIRLFLASEFLDSEPRRSMIPWGGLWAAGIASITDNNTGATAAYKILREKLVMWCAPHQQASTPSASSIASPAAAAMLSSNSAVKRLHAQAPMANDDEETDEVLLSSSSSSSSILEPQQKRPRCHLLPSKSNDKESSTTTTAITSIASLSREELFEMIQQKNQQIADQDVKISELADTIATLVKKNTMGAEMEEREKEDDQHVAAAAAATTTL